MQQLIMADFLAAEDDQAGIGCVSREYIMRMDDEHDLVETKNSTH